MEENLTKGACPLFLSCGALAVLHNKTFRRSALDLIEKVLKGRFLSPSSNSTLGFIIGKRGHWEGLFENDYINEGIPTDLKKDCTATIPLVLRIPSGHHIHCTEAPHLA